MYKCQVNLSYTSVSSFAPKLIIPEQNLKYLYTYITNSIFVYRMSRELTQQTSPCRDLS